MEIYIFLLFSFPILVIFLYNSFGGILFLKTIFISFFIPLVVSIIFSFIFSIFILVLLFFIIIIYFFYYKELTDDNNQFSFLKLFIFLKNQILKHYYVNFKTGYDEIICTPNKIINFNKDDVTKTFNDYKINLNFEKEFDPNNIIFFFKFFFF
jgi:hypothetical protein